MGHKCEFRHYHYLSAPKTVAAKASHPPRKTPTEQRVHECVRQHPGPPSPRRPFCQDPTPCPKAPRERKPGAKSANRWEPRSRSLRPRIEGADRPIDEKIARPPPHVGEEAQRARQSQANPPLAPPASDASKTPPDMPILPIWRRVGFYRRASYLKSQCKIVER